ncbi:MAG: J domain-containing protein [Bacteroidia bacterium]|nr:J domain-containing protein [Bacteroidia bacterium]
MLIKDYYSILKLSPSASPSDIKKAYRKLAQQYHPDKHNNDPYKAVQFEQIKEAYEILNNPVKKNYYLQKRWYNLSLGKKFSSNETVTPAAILKQCLELNRYVASLDIHRMNREGLAEYICDILSNSIIEQLKAFKEPEINKSIIACILDTIEPLHPPDAEQVSIQLNQLADENIEIRALIIKTLNRLKRKERQRKNQPLLLLLITIIICLLMYLVGR